MLASAKAFSSFAVNDLEAAREFYGETLGLGTSGGEGQMPLLMLQLGDRRETMVYEKPDFSPATYTVLNFGVDDIDAEVDELSSKGIVFERYEGFEQDEKGIARGGEGRGPSIAWFKDPAGNILSVLQQA